MNNQPQIHVANTDFEFELENSSRQTIQESLKCHPLTLQLQFLPVLIAEENDLIAVTEMPDPSYISNLITLGISNIKSSQFILLETEQKFPNFQISPWGHSKNILKWAQEHTISYKIPEWNIVKEINSKAYIYKKDINISNSLLLNNEKDFESWWKNLNSPFVLKTCFGVSGRGNRIVSLNSNKSELLKICSQQWSKELPMIAEPWLNRIFDFSTQWFIHKPNEFELVGSTVFETDPKGIYKATISGPEEHIFGKYLSFLKEHLDIVKETIQEISQEGFLGAVGFDALLYKNEVGETKLYPIVEINGRQTMSLIALKLQKRWSKDIPIKIIYSNSESSNLSLLPDHVGQAIFKKKLILNKLQ